MTKDPTFFPNQDVYKRRKGGGNLIYVGIPLLVSGMIFYAIFLTGAERGLTPPGMKSFLFLLCPCLVLSGVVIILWRSGVEIDRLSGKIHVWYGLLFPFWRRTYALEEIDRVVMDREIQQTENSSFMIYPVRLQGNSLVIDIESPQDELQARSIAEEIAKFLNRPLHDASDGIVRIREPQYLDESLRDRIRRTGEIPSLPPLPEGMKATLLPQGKEIEIRLPPAGFTREVLKRMSIRGSFPLFLIFFILIPLLFETQRVPFANLVIGIVISMLFFILCLIVIAGIQEARRSVTLIANPQFLRLVIPRLFSPRVIEMAADRIEEIRIGNPPPENAESHIAGAEKIVIVRSDDAVIRFGAGLSEEELRYLATLLEILIATG